MRIRRVSRLGLGRNVKLRVDACRFGYGWPDFWADGLRCDQARPQEASSLIFPLGQKIEIMITHDEMVLWSQALLIGIGLIGVYWSKRRHIHP